MVRSRLSTPLWRTCSRPAARQQTRQLSLHQHNSQKLLDQAGAPVPQGRVVRSAAEAKAAVQELGKTSVISAQVLHNRRKGPQKLQNGAGAAGVVVPGPDKADTVASELLGNKAQAADEDITIKELYISEAVQYEELWYLAMTVDRENYLPSIVVSKTGQGRDIQTIAKQNPESIMTFNFKLTEGIPDELVERIAAELELQANDSANLATVLRSLHRIFIEKDAMLLEIGSLGRTKDGKLICLDSNFTFDDDASKRQPDLFALRDKGQEVTDEVEAEKYGLVYVRMDGDIGNVVNGAGLAMATNDAVCLHGGQSANFLDAGGQATTETMMQAFGIILRDKRVKSILVNIYGGITRCDMIAESIIGAASKMDIHVPMVVRLQGTNSEAGLKLLADADLGLYVESDFGEAAKKAVELAKAA